MATFNHDPAPLDFNWTIQWKNNLSRLIDQLKSFFRAPEFPSVTTDTLIIEGDAIIDGSLEIEDDISAQDAAFSGEVNIGEDLSVGGFIDGENSPIEFSSNLSGISFSLPPVPSWVRKIYIRLVAVSTSGTAVIRLRVGTGGVATTSGYVGTTASYSGATVANFTAGFDGTGTSAAASRNGIYILMKDPVSNTWVCQFSFGRSDTAAGEHGAGSVALSGALDFIQLTTSNGTDTLDASGTIMSRYEY